MCIEIIKPNLSVSYDVNVPVEEQIKGSKEIVIDCSPTCEKVVKFLSEIEKICDQGHALGINIKITNPSNLNIYKKTKKINEELAINDIISNLVLFHKKADDGLKEISEMCYKGKCER